MAEPETLPSCESGHRFLGDCVQAPLVLGYVPSTAIHPLRSPMLPDWQAPAWAQLGIGAVHLYSASVLWAMLQPGLRPQSSQVAALWHERAESLPVQRTDGRSYSTSTHTNGRLEGQHVPCDKSVRSQRTVATQVARWYQTLPTPGAYNECPTQAPWQLPDRSCHPPCVPAAQVELQNLYRTVSCSSMNFPDRAGRLQPGPDLQ